MSDKRFRTRAAANAVAARLQGWANARVERADTIDHQGRPIKAYVISVQAPHDTPQADRRYLQADGQVR